MRRSTLLSEDRMRRDEGLADATSWRRRTRVEVSQMEERQRRKMDVPLQSKMTAQLHMHIPCANEAKARAQDAVSDSQSDHVLI